MHSLFLFFFSTLLSAALGAPSLSRRATCTVQSQLYEVFDDAPLINKALRDCGAGGIILLPPGQNYSIRSPVDFSPCQHCEVQVEGTLLMSVDWNFWTNKTAYMSAIGAKGLTLHSLTGNGLIDGNARGWYQRYHMPFYVSDPYEFQPILMLITESQDIRISGLQLQNAPREFFRVDGGSRGVAFSDLRVVVQDQWYQLEHTMWESSAFQLRNSSSIHLSDIVVDFRTDDTPWRATAGTGACVMLDWGLDDVSVSDISCSGTFYGVMVQFSAVDMDKCIPPPPVEAQVSRNIVIRNYTANSDHNAGFLHGPQIGRPQVYNLTYDTVTIVNGSYLENSANYDLPIHCRYTWTPDFVGNYTDIWFKNFRGNLGVPNDKSPVFCKSYDCLNGWFKGTYDFHFEGMPVYVPPGK